VTCSERSSERTVERCLHISQSVIQAMFTVEGKCAIDRSDLISPPHVGGIPQWQFMMEAGKHAATEVPA
jgi:hypothetical protein